MILLSRRNILWFLLLFIISIPLNAQTQGEQSGAQYVLPGSGSSVRFQINLWGQIAAPGVYRVPIDTDIISLISGAGGPLETAKLRKVKILRLTAQDSSPRIVEANIQRYLKTGKREALPQLQAGDTIIIPRQANFFSSEAFTIFTSLTTSIGGLILIWDRLSRTGAF